MLNDCNHSYTWDSDGNSITVDSVSSTFDAFDRMVEQNRSGTYTQIVYSPGGGKLALMSGQTLQKAFVSLPGQATAVYTSSGLDHYRHSDWLGSARLTSSPSQAYVSSVAYAPFGETYASSGATDSSFTGMNPDTTGSSTNNDYDFLFREYSNEGRWTHPDPAGLAAVDPSNPQSWNRYSYVLNNPLALIDPSGLDTIGGSVSLGGCEYAAETGISCNDTGQTMSCTVDGVATACGEAFNLFANGSASITQQIEMIISFQGPGLQCEPSDEVEGTPSTCTADFQSIGFHTWGTESVDNSDWGAWDTIRSMLPPLSLSVSWLGGPIIPGVVHWGSTYQITYIGPTNRTCVSAGLAVGTPGKSWSFGPLVLGDVNNAEGILKGFSWGGSVQTNPVIGAVNIRNLSGKLGGPTVGSPGAIFTGTYGACFGGNQ